MAICQNCHTIQICDFYVYPFETEETLLCSECAANLGFCICCQQFMAGNELDEHSGLPGVCYECMQVLKDELGEFDEPLDYEGW